MRRLASDTNLRQAPSCFGQINTGDGTFERSGNVRTGLHYASVAGLEAFVNAMLKAGTGVMVREVTLAMHCRRHRFDCHKKAVDMVIERGAEVNAQGGEYGNALRAASLMGHEKVAKMLIELRRETQVGVEW